MSALTAPLICLPMARKAEKQSDTSQVNFRFPDKLLERMERFSEAHPLNPTLTRIAIAAVEKWLDEEEPKVRPPKK